MSRVGEAAEEKNKYQDADIWVSNSCGQVRFFKFPDGVDMEHFSVYKSLWDGHISDEQEARVDAMCEEIEQTMKNNWNSMAWGECDVGEEGELDVVDFVEL